MTYTSEMKSKHTKPMDLIKIIQNQFEMGINHHIYIRGLIPDLEEFPNIDGEFWSAFRDEIEQQYDWKRHHKYSWRQFDLTERFQEIYCIHFEKGVTIFKNEKYGKIQLIFDSDSDQKVVNKLRGKIQQLQLGKNIHSVGMIHSSNGHLYVRFCGFKPYKYDLIPFMGAEIQQFKQQLVSQLRKKNQSGLYLLHGEPGTGKTSFLKQILADVEKKSLFISPSLVEQLTSPGLIRLLMDYPNSILIIEDAETVLMKREADNSNSVANLLNLTDGFPADFLHLNIICTFNTGLEEIDPALLREGRLRGIQRFAKLPLNNAIQMAQAVGVDIEIDKPMTVAEICNPKMENINIYSTTVGFS